MIDLLNGRPGDGAFRMLWQSGELGVSAMTVYELVFGTPPGDPRAALDHALASFEIMSISAGVAAIAAEHGARLARDGNSLAVPDLLIAGTALASRLPLFTRNVRHFNRIDGLQILDPLS